MSDSEPIRRGPHAQRRAAARAELIRLGHERFPVKGYADTTIDDIVAGSGIARSTWYYYFGDKDDYFLELIRARSAPRGEWWHIADDPAVTTIEQAVTAAFGTFRRVDPDYTAWILLLVEFWHTQRDHPERRGVLRELYQGYIDELSRFIDGLRARGMVTSSVPSDRLAAALLALTEGALTHGAVYGADSIVDVGLIAAVLRAR